MKTIRARSALVMGILTVAIVGIIGPAEAVSFNATFNTVRATAGTSSITMTSPATTFCYLKTYRVEGTTGSAEFASCAIDHFTSGNYVLNASVGAGTTPAQVNCSAVCMNL